MIYDLPAYENNSIEIKNISILSFHDLAKFKKETILFKIDNFKYLNSKEIKLKVIELKNKKNSKN